MEEKKKEMIERREMRKYIKINRYKENKRKIKLEKQRKKENRTKEKRNYNTILQTFLKTY